MSGTVFEVVTAHAGKRPDALALSGAGLIWTYRELTDAAERLAGGLAARGVVRGETFAIVADNHPTTALAWLAGQRSGAIPSNCNSLLRERELSWILGNLSPKLVITDAQHVDIVRAALDAAQHDAEIILNVACDEHPGLVTLDELQQSPPYIGRLPAADDPFEITYTSGTTSNPKGVVLTHAAVLHRAAAQQRQFGLGEEDVALVGTPLFHQSGSRDCVLLIWHAGGHAAIMPKFTASGYWKHAKAVGATYTCMVETMALLLERQPEGPDDKSHGIRMVMSGAPAPLRLRAQERFGFKMVGGYGMTECGFPVAIPREQSLEELEQYLSFRPGANFAGWPVEENEVRIVDPDGRDVAEGETGEIRIKSGGLLKEYWRNPEATAASLKDGWLHSGDSGMRGPNGSVYFVDRIKDMIRRGGENVAPKEIEDIIHGHPDVAQAVAYPVPDPLYIQEAKVIVIAKPGQTLTAQQIWDWCEPRMAKYKVPRYVEFRESVPTGGSGRAQKSELRQEPIEGLGRTYDRISAALVGS